MKLTFGQRIGLSVFIGATFATAAFMLAKPVLAQVYGTSTDPSTTASASPDTSSSTQPADSATAVVEGTSTSQISYDIATTAETPNPDSPAPATPSEPAP